MINEAKTTLLDNSDEFEENTSHLTAGNDKRPDAPPTVGSSAGPSDLLTENKIKIERRGFTGTVDNFQITDIIQMFCRSAGSIAISVSQDDDHGLIYIENGEIIHAQCDSLAGREAFVTILTWPNGIFKTLAPPSKMEPTINEPSEFLLLEAARRADEMNNLKNRNENTFEEEIEFLNFDDTTPALDLDDDSNFEDIKVNLLFKLGRMKIDFQSLKTVKPGTVFCEITKQNTVDIIANGKIIGTGELVGHNSMIGIRFIE